MTAEIFPLFGQAWSPFDYEPSLEPAESACIKAQLERLDPMLEAPASYRLVREYLNAKNANTESQNAARIMERLLIWCFFVKKQSALKLAAPDLLEFCLFYAEPPHNFVSDGIRCKRHLMKDGCCIANPDWRPFKRNRYDSVEYIRGRLNVFYRYLTKYIGHTVNLPRELTDRYLQPTDPYESLKDQARRYFALYLECGSLKDSRKYERRYPEEGKLFILATCFFLKISLSELVKVVDYFSMSRFKLVNGKCALSVPGAFGDLNRDVPPEYLIYLYRYRAYLGLEPIPTESELAPIFKSRAYARHLMRSLPSYDGIPTPGKLFMKLRPYWDLELAGMAPTSTLNLKRSSYPPVQDRLGHFPQEHVPNDIRPIESNAPPPPLCYFWDSKNPAAMEVDSFQLQRRMATVLEGYSFEAEPLYLFASYANSVAGQKSRLKVKAFEKLALWSCMVNNKPISELTTRDAEAFYVFCACPPLNWRIKGHPKRHILDRDTMLLAPNPLWRPFRIGVENRSESSRRAGRVIIWCDAIMQDLLIDGKVDHNAFAMLSKNLT
ncbi:hypothetical protein F3J44_21360 [Pantoea sp. Tr-811]|uniref:hypothetical protein n=1 Tax=Pantoea sp. Tr-811 TaxID=2608361 RepID=UPI001423634F|nr:hypothetical protein [Pantoea sp. Tr-811]NIF28916.1 hypothetical protein [Pantoea sp. Tr-811]